MIQNSSQSQPLIQRRFFSACMLFSHIPVTGRGFKFKLFFHPLENSVECKLVCPFVIRWQCIPVSNSRFCQLKTTIILHIRC